MYDCRLSGEARDDLPPNHTDSKHIVTAWTMNIFKPQPDISYSFISAAYAIGFSICIIFSVLEFVLHRDEIKGFWIIFAPFGVCLLWSLAMQHSVKKLETDKDSKQKKE